MRRPAILMLVLILIGAPNPLWAKEEPGSGRLAILYVNDFHGALEPAARAAADGAVGGAARLVRLAAGIRRANERAGIATLVVSSGDFLEGPPLSNANKGALEARMLNRMGLCAYTLGNHDLDFGPARLAAFMGEIKAPCVTANFAILGKRAGAPLVVRAGGVLVGIAGLVAARQFSTEKPEVDPAFLQDVRASDETAAARAAVADLKRRGAAFVVLLTHLGEKGDRRLAAAVSGIDVICGGHSHTPIRGLVRAGGAALVQAGSEGRWLGRLDVVFKKGRPVSIKAGLIPITAGLPEDPETARELAGKKKELAASLGNEVLAQNRCLLEGDPKALRTRETGSGDLAADAMREELHADAAVLNGGAIRAAIAPGPVTRELVRAMLPYTESPTLLLSVTGQDIALMLSHSARQTGGGGFLQVSGLSFVTVPLAGAYSVKVGEEPLDKRRVYTLAVNSFIATGGDGYTMLRDVPAERRSAHPCAADLLERFLRTRFGRAGKPLEYCGPAGRIREGLPLSGVELLPLRPRAALTPPLSALLDSGPQKAYPLAGFVARPFSHSWSAPCSALE